MQKLEQFWFERKKEKKKEIFLDFCHEKRKAEARGRQTANSVSGSLQNEERKERLFFF